MAIYSIEDFEQAVETGSRRFNIEVTKYFKGSNWVEVNGAGGSDYSGSSVNAANHLWFEENQEKSSDVVFFYGLFGTYGVAYNSKTEDQELLSIVNGLEDYPLIDEETHVRIEEEWKDTMWNNCYVSDFRSELTDHLNVEEIHITDEELRTEFFKAIEDNSLEWRSMYSCLEIDLDEVIHSMDIKELQCNYVMTIAIH